MTAVSLGVLAVGVLLVAATVRVFEVPGHLAGYVVGGLVAGTGSLVAAYGVREFLRAAGGGYYCCNHLFYQSLGGLLAVVGWTALLLGVGLARQE